MARTKKSTKKTKNVKISVLYAQLVQSLEVEAETGKNYRGIQRALTALKKKGLVTIKCNSKKEVLLAEAKKVLAIREDRKNKFLSLGSPLAA